LKSVHQRAVTYHGRKYGGKVQVQGSVRPRRIRVHSARGVLGERS
jgi:hypothetical protein